MKKIVIYAHEGVGYGHLDRMGKLNDILSLSDKDIKLIYTTSYPYPNKFVRNWKKTTHLKLPQYDLNESYKHSKETASIKKERQKILERILVSSDLIIIDFFPFGTRNELYELLPKIKCLNPNVSIILTQRGIIFDKEKTIQFFKYQRGINFINKVFDEVIVFCDSRIIDINEAYFENKISRPITYLGYLGRFSQKKEMQLNSICIDFGGGYSSERCIIKLINILSNNSLTKDFSITIYVGEYSDYKAIKEAVENAHNEKIKTLQGVSPDEILNQKHEYFIGGGGYNSTINHILNNSKTTIIPKQTDLEASLHMNSLKKLAPISILNEDRIEELPKQLLGNSWKEIIKIRTAKTNDIINKLL